MWRALITQDAASGFRQIFESGDKMIVTRLTQRPAQALTPEAEAMLIERELRSSISYIKRLGFSDGDRLDVVVLADPAVCRAVDDRDLPATTETVNTPYQAGVLLDLGEIGREDSPFADVLLGLWVAKKRRRTMTLPTARISQQIKLTSITRWSAATAFALTLLAAFLYGVADRRLRGQRQRPRGIAGAIGTRQNPAWRARARACATTLSPWKS